MEIPKLYAPSLRSLFWMQGLVIRAILAGVPRNDIDIESEGRCDKWARAYSGAFPRSSVACTSGASYSNHENLCIYTYASSKKGSGIGGCSFVCIYSLGSPTGFLCLPGQEGIVRFEMKNDLPLGRNMKEMWASGLSHGLAE